MSPSMVKEQIKFRSFRNTCMFTLIQLLYIAFSVKRKTRFWADACMICMSKMHETFN